MAEFSLEADLFGVCFVALIGSVIGLAGSIGWLGRGIIGPLALATLLGATAGLLAAAAPGANLWPAPAFLAAICAALAALRWSRSAASARLKWARSATLHWAALLVISPTTAAGWAWAVCPPEYDDLPLPADVADPASVFARDSEKCAETDAGTPIPLFHRLANLPAPDLLPDDGTAFTSGAYPGRPVCTAPADDHYDCHGWVFTGGRFWIQGRDVDTIVRDNGYQVVTEPRQGDLILYRSEDQISHSGIVRSAGPGEPLLIESKWGKGGRYIHAPQEAPYTGHVTYYRSDRPGHLLRGLEDTPLAADTTIAHPR